MASRHVLDILVISLLLVGATVAQETPLPDEEPEPVAPLPEESFPPDEAPETSEEGVGAEAEPLPQPETPPEADTEPGMPRISPQAPVDLEIKYYPEYHGGLRLCFWLYPPHVSGRPLATDDAIDFRSFTDGWTMSLAAFFELQTPTDKVFTLELWSMSKSSIGTMSGNVQWGGGTFTTGENVAAASRVRFYGLSYGTPLFQRDDFEFGMYLGVDFADVDLSIASTTTTEYGSLSRLVPTLTVGFNLWYYPHKDWGMYGRLTGLSWTDLLGFEGGVFNPSGDYQLLELGGVWRPRKNATVLAGYRRFLVRYDLTEEALDVDLSGVFVGASIEW